MSEIMGGIRETPAPTHCPHCGGALTWLHDHRLDNYGLDDGPYLPGKAPRKKADPKTAEEMRAIRARAWETRREKTL